MKKPKILTTGTTTKLPLLKPFVDWYLKPNIPNGATMISSLHSYYKDSIFVGKQPL